MMKDANCSMTHCKKSQSGLAVIEFVIVLLMLIPMMVATVEFGRYLHQYNTLTKAVRDGARYAGDNVIVKCTGNITVCSAIEGEIQNLVAFGNTVQANGTEILRNIAASDVTVTAIDVTGFTNPSHIKVSADYDFSPLFSFIPDNLGITMTASTVQRAL